MNPVTLTPLQLDRFRKARAEWQQLQTQAQQAERHLLALGDLILEAHGLDPATTVAEINPENGELMVQVRAPKVKADDTTKPDRRKKEAS